LQKCADYGYRRLAGQIVTRMIQATGETPILVGAGAPKPAAHTPRPQPRLAAYIPPPASQTQVQFVSQIFDNPGTIYVFSSSLDDSMSIHRPLTKEEAISETQSDLEESLGELINHPNLFVSLIGIAAAIPTSLYLQTAGAIRGIPEKKYRAADALVTNATLKKRPAAALAGQFAQTLSSRYSATVVLLEKPRDGVEENTKLPPAAEKPMLVSWHGHGKAKPHAGDKAIEIEVLSAGLKGNGRINPSLAVQIEARATLLRADDGSEIYSCPVHYCGRTRKFTAWAAHDASLLRDELQNCNEEVSRAVIDQMVARHVIAPGENLHSFLAYDGK
jgi:hypothetical protein